jgi:hypothetical protein
VLMVLLTCSLKLFAPIYRVIIEKLKNNRN